MLRLKSPNCTAAGHRTRMTNSARRATGCAYTCLVVPLRVRRVYPLLAVHRAIMVVDAARFDEPVRTNLDQLAVREALFRAPREAFATSGIGCEGCVSEDRGYDALILIPPEVPGTSSPPYKSIYSHVQGGFKSLQSLLRRTSS